MKRYFIIAGAAILIALAAFAFGRYSAPERIKEVEKIKVVEVEKKQQNEKKDVVTVITKKPDGTSVTTVTDKTVVDTKTDTDTVATSEKTREVTYRRPQWKLTGMAGFDTDTSDFTSVKPIYGAAVERRLLGPIFVGAWGLSNRTFGVSVALEF